MLSYYDTGRYQHWFDSVDSVSSREQQWRQRDEAAAPGYLKASPPVAVPRIAPSQEVELIKDLRRIHESSHLVIGEILGLKANYVDARRTQARIEWTIPGGRAGTIGFLVALAASKA